MNFGDNILPERFWDKLIPEPNTGCWLWLAGTTAGRASYWAGDRFVRPHRMAYEIAVGSLAEQQRVHWSCGVENCCNPLHVVAIAKTTPEERRQYKRDWKQSAGASPERVEKRRVASRAAHRRDPDRARRVSREWQQKNGQKVRTAMRSWRDRNPDKIKAQSKKQRLKRYGLTPESFEKLLDDHKGRCGICDVDLDRTKGIGRNLHIDHCHASGVVRGLLCGKCNLGLGLFADNTDRLQGAIDYLKRSRNGPR